MKIYNEDKTKILDENSIDLTKGELIDSYIDITIPAIEEVEEQGHYELIAEYPNGGKDYEWVIDVQRVDPQPEKVIQESIKVFHLYTKEQLIEKNLYEYTEEELLEQRKKEWYTKQYLRIMMYKDELNKTDYRAIKYAEGWYTEDEYRPFKEERQLYRFKINRLQELEYEGNEDIDFENF